MRVKSRGRRALFWRGAESVQPMAQAQDGVLPEHTRSGKAHDSLHLFATLRLITVDRAIGASRLRWTETAALQAHCGVIKQFLAFGTERLPALMLLPAIA